ncbi:MAG: hypothetical protein ACOCSE_05340 [Chitinivibrionales bacterium]
MMNTESSKLRTGKRPVQTVVRSVPEDKTLCTEGSEGRELYIVFSKEMISRVKKIRENIEIFREEVLF